MLNLKSFMVAFALLPIRSNALPIVQERQTNATDHWVDTWTSMPQLVESSNLPSAPYISSSAVFNGATLRQTLHMSISGSTIQLQISNTFGGSDLPITAASLGLPAGGLAGSSDIQTSTLRGLTFNGGAASITIPKRTVAYTDPIDFAVQPQSMLTVSLYLENGQTTNSITGHPGSRTTSWMVQGNAFNSTSVKGASLEHWYFVSDVEVFAPVSTSAWITLGDSIMDDRGSDTNKNNRWPDLVLAKMQSAGIKNINVDNQAAEGSRVLADGLGPSLISRYKRDAINQEGVKYVMVFEGVNDIGTAGADQSSQTNMGNQLIAALKQIAADCKNAGIPVFASTITPFSAPSASQQSYSSPVREATRQKVNTYIKTAGSFDVVIDFDAMVRDPNTPSQLASKYNSGDYLHPNDAGYAAIAEAFPVDIFAKFAS